MRRIAGFTLMEQLFTLACCGIVAAGVLPGLSAFVQEQRVIAEVNGFVASIQLARSESQRLRRPVTLCASADGDDCGDDLARGWIVFQDGDGNGTRGPEEALISAYPGGSVRRVVSSRQRFVYRPLGRRSTNGTVTFCHPDGPTRSRAVVVSYTGRPRVSRELADGDPLPC